MSQMIDSNNENSTNKVANPECVHTSVSHAEAYCDLFPRTTRVQPECQVVLEGGPSLETRAKKCQKNPGHTKFIPIQEYLKAEDNHYLAPDHITDMRNLADRVVRVLGFAVSDDRPDVYPNSSNPYPYSHLKGRKNCIYICGTGFISFYTYRLTQCKCPTCVKSKRPKTGYHEITVETAAHVVYNDEEASKAIFECFYDSEERKGVKCLYGMEAYSKFGRDTCTVSCVTHDEELAQRIKYIVNVNLYPPDAQSTVDHYASSLIISHPHGLCKQVSLGSVLSCVYNEELAANDDGSFRLPFSFQEPLPGAVRCNNDDELYTYHRLPNAATWVFPKKPDPGLFFNNEYFHSDSEYVKVPSGTQIKLPGGELVDCPDELELNFLDLSNFQLVYDISTCPGSSGAPVFGRQAGTSVDFSCHSGAVGVGRNISTNRHFNFEYDF